MSEEIDNVISDNLKNPRCASGDAGSVEQHSLPDQIAADKYLQSKKASCKSGMGIKLVKLSPDGAI